MKMKEQYADLYDEKHFLLREKAPQGGSSLFIFLLSLITFLQQM